VNIYACNNATNTSIIAIIEILVALLQAYIFTMLSALYFGFAVEDHSEAH
jgi:F-type H+-transporting ATPase subunit a